MLARLFGGKKYQLTPIELVRWAEPLFGKDGKPAAGIPEEQIASYEASAGIRLPKVFREYLRTCGNASLNRMLHRIQMPDPGAEPFKDNLTFSYEYVADALDCNDPEDDSPEEKKLRALPRERWGEVVDDYLLICVENEGSWMAGIRKQDLDQPDPPVWREDGDSIHWVEMHGSVSALLMGVMIETILVESEAESDYIDQPQEIQAVLKKHGVDFARLKGPTPFVGGEQVHTCLDTKSNTLFVYHEADKERPEALSVYKEWGTLAERLAVKFLGRD